MLSYHGQHVLFSSTKLEKHKITMPNMLVHERVHVVCVSVKQVGKLQLYSLFLVKGGVPLLLNGIQE